MDKPVIRDGALVLLRLVAGLIFILHGCQMFIAPGVDATVAHFTQLGVPAPQLAVYAAGVLQIAAGALLIIGLLTTMVAGLMAVFMLAVLYFVHDSIAAVEYPALMVTSMLMIVVFGSGRLSLDEVLSQ